MMMSLAVQPSGAAVLLPQAQKVWNIELGPPFGGGGKKKGMIFPKLEMTELVPAVTSSDFLPLHSLKLFRFFPRLLTAYAPGFERICYQRSRVP